MKKIYKYPMRDRPVVMPTGSEILKISVQNEVATLWALVDTDKPMAERTFETYATGQDILKGRKYIDTYFKGPFVWHVFEVI